MPLADLLDRGWRRSGCFLYKPDMEKTCCPSYTIRLKASDFVPSNEQLRVSRRMQRYPSGVCLSTFGHAKYWNCLFHGFHLGHWSKGDGPY